MLLLLVPRAASAQVVAFDEDAWWSYVGTAEEDHPHGVELAKSLGDVGAAWVDVPVSIPGGGGFRGYFVAELDPGWDGGGGMVLALQGAGPYALGTGDYGLGYEGIAPSLAIEIDVFQSAYTYDPDDNHVGVDRDGSIESVLTASPAFDLDAWSTDVHVWVDAVGGELAVYVSDGYAKPYEPLLVDAFDPASLPDPLWVGFTAAAGDQDAARRVPDFWFVADGDADGDGLLDFEDPYDDAPPGSTPPDPTGTDPTGWPYAPDDDHDDDDTVSDDEPDDAADLPPVFFCGCGPTHGAPIGGLAVVLALARRGKGRGKGRGCR